MTARSAIAGHPTVVSAGYYLDWMMPSSFHYLIDPLDTTAHGISQDQLERARGTPVGALLSDDNVITAPIALDSEQANRILGGEAAMWTELVSDESLDGRVWPRMAAMAERFWSARSCRDVDSLYERLSSLDVGLEILGLRHRANSRKMLDRMTAEDSTAIQALAAILEPSKYYSRLFPRIQEAEKAGLMLTDLPINDLSDAVLPESLPARRFHQDVKRMLSAKEPDPDLNAGIRTRLTLWSRNHAEFQKIAPRSFLLVDALAVSSDVKELADVGLEALDALRARRPPDRTWLAKARALIEKRKKEIAAPDGMAGSLTAPPPLGGLVIALVPGIEALVDALVPMTPGQ
jgi:hexosaminidase